MSENIERKMTLEEYQQINRNPVNVKAAKSFLFIFVAAIAVVMIVSLFFVVMRLFEIHEIAGYVGAAGSVILFIFAFLVPVIKLKNTKSFITNVNIRTAREAQKYNKQLREEIADKMIDITYQTEGVGWYSDNNINRLDVARRKKNDKDLKVVLTDIYKTDVNKSAQKMIRSVAVKVGLATAISQSDFLDTALVLTYELNLIKDIVFLYGFRPTDSQMVKIYQSVLRNALIAYGVSNATSGLGKTIGTGFVSAIDKASKSGNLMTSAIGSVVGGIAGTAIESGIQFAVNTTLTIIIGFQTKKYLMREYNLQDMLDTVEILVDEKEEVELMESIKEEVKETISKRQKMKKQDLEETPV